MSHYPPPHGKVKLIKALKEQAYSRPGPAGPASMPLAMSRLS
jgi:hypothetical protein